MSSTQTTDQGPKRDTLLSVNGVKLGFHTYAGDVKALDGVELTVYKGEILGLVGESGCGKSVTALSIVGLLPENAEVKEGEIWLGNQNLLKMSKNEMRLARLREIAIVFQDPMTYLNPVMTIGSQIMDIMTSERKAFQREVVESRLKEIDQIELKQGKLTPELEAQRRTLKNTRNGEHLSNKEFESLARLRALFYLRLVKLPDPDRVFKMYPFELSGGMRQRSMISMALLRRPKLLLADEITTAVDVSVQAQILELLKELKKEIGCSVILITHDLAVVAEISDRVAVMYAGNIVEVADVKELFANPLHPYTRGLLSSIPRSDSLLKEMKSIPGSVPDLMYPPSGCRFHPRCPLAFDKCDKVKPRLVEARPGHFVSCLLFGE